MDTTSTGRPAGKTGPIAAAVIARTISDLATPPQNSAEGAGWSLNARLLGAHVGRGHVISVMADRQVEGGFAGNGAYE